MSSYLSQYNLSPLAFPVAWLLALAPHIYGMRVCKLYDNNRAEGAPAWNKASPRQHLKEDRFKAAQIPSEIMDKCFRANGAQQNGYENFAFFGVVLLAGNVAKLSNMQLNGFVGLYLASRVAYNISYIQNSSHQKADWRSVFFNTGVVLNWIVFVKACWKINPMSNT